MSVRLASHVHHNLLQMTKFYKLSYGKVYDDDDDDAELISEILNEVLAIVAPSNLSISYAVYMVPLREQVNEYRWEEVYAHDVFALVKCVNPECISAELQTHLANILKERNLHRAFGCGTLSELSQKDFDELSKTHRREQA